MNRSPSPDFRRCSKRITQRQARHKTGQNQRRRPDSSCQTPARSIVTRVFQKLAHQYRTEKEHRIKRRLARFEVPRERTHLSDGINGICTIYLSRRKTESAFRITAAATPASSDPPIMPRLAASTNAVSWNASIAINSDMVKPIPASHAQPSKDVQFTALRRFAIPDFTVINAPWRCRVGYQRSGLSTRLARENR